MEVIEQVKKHTQAAKIERWYLDEFPRFARFAKQRGGSLDQAKDVFQESMITYFEKCKDSNFSPEKSDGAYLFGIAKKKWLKHCAQRRHYEVLEQLDLPEVKETEIKAQKVLAHLRRTGEKCMELLQAFYYQKLSMSELAERYGYRSERSVTVQKYKCLEKVRDEVKNKSIQYEDFFE